MAYTYDAEAFRPVFEENFTWINGFLRNVRRSKDRPALIDPPTGRVWTYRTLNEDANRLANALAARGVGKNELVFYQLPNSPAFVFCYLAPQKLGAVNCPANYNLSPGETARLLSHDRPKVYVYDCDYAAVSQQALALSSWKPALILAVDSRHERPALPEGHVFFDELTADAACTEPAREPANLYDEVTRMYTSGTTGLAKGIPSNNVTEVLSAHDVIMHFPLNPLDVTMNMTPWFHRGGLHSGGLTPTLYAGGCCVVLRMFSAKTCLEYAQTYGVTFLVGVPAVLANLAARQERHPVSLPALKGIVTMGSPLEREACIRFQRLLTPNIFNGYGTTETFWNSFLRPYELPEMAGTAGRSCTDDEVRVVRVYADGRRAEPDDTVPTDGKTTGEIIIFSCCKSVLSYHDNPELTAEKYYKGWLYTHDLGTWDERQFITVAGRKDDMLISMGENIYPAQVEEVLCRCPGVRDCIVTGVPDAGRGEAVAAYVVPDGSQLTVQALNHYCVTSPDLPACKVPRYYAFVETLPYTATGKKQHFVLRARAPEDQKSGLLKRP